MVTVTYTKNKIHVRVLVFYLSNMNFISEIYILDKDLSICICKYSKLLTLYSQSLFSNDR